MLIPRLLKLRLDAVLNLRIGNVVYETAAAEEFWTVPQLLPVLSQV